MAFEDVKLEAVEELAIIKAAAKQVGKFNGLIPEDAGFPAINADNGYRYAAYPPKNEETAKRGATVTKQKQVKQGEERSQVEARFFVNFFSLGGISVSKMTQQQ